jgi:hypothetical protein
MAYMLVLDLGDFTIYSVLVFARWDFKYNMSGYCLDNAWLIALGWRCRSINTLPFDTWRLGIVNTLSVGDHIVITLN